MLIGTLEALKKRFKSQWSTVAPGLTNCMGYMEKNAVDFLDGGWASNLLNTEPYKLGRVLHAPACWQRLWSWPHYKPQRELYCALFMFISEAPWFHQVPTAIRPRSSCFRLDATIMPGSVAHAPFCLSYSRQTKAKLTHNFLILAIKGPSWPMQRLKENASSCVSNANLLYHTPLGSLFHVFMAIPVSGLIQSTHDIVSLLFMARLWSRYLFDNRWRVFTDFEPPNLLVAMLVRLVNEKSLFHTIERWLYESTFYKYRRWLTIIQGPLSPPFPSSHHHFTQSSSLI